MPGLTRDRLRGGWFVTDDFGRVDAAGRVVVESGRGRIINVAGTKLDPREVELALLSLPGVREAAVVGRQRKAGTEEEWAFVVAAPAPRHGRRAAQDPDGQGALERGAGLRRAPG